jgi:hypothetical protein
VCEEIPIVSKTKTGTVPVRHSRAQQVAQILLASASLAVAIHGGAAPTKIALVSTAPSADLASDCIREQLGADDGIVAGDRLIEGLEFRITQHGEDAASRVIAITGLLKPSAAGLALGFDDEPEAHPQAVERVYELLRIHVGTRAWAWPDASTVTFCAEAAQWIGSLRSRPVLLEKLGPDGEVRSQRDQ